MLIGVTLKDQVQSRAFPGQVDSVSRAIVVSWVSVVSRHPPIVLFINIFVSFVNIGTSF